MLAPRRGHGVFPLFFSGVTPHRSISVRTPYILPHTPRTRHSYDEFLVSRRSCNPMLALRRGHEVVFFSGTPTTTSVRANPDSCLARCGRASTSLCTGGTNSPPVRSNLYARAEARACPPFFSGDFHDGRAPPPSSPFPAAMYQLLSLSPPQKKTY